MKIQRYMTKGIHENLPIELQFFLWDLQMKLRAPKKDINYLQKPITYQPFLRIPKPFK